jgi:hypothetical protein
MSINPDVDGIGPLGQQANGAQAEVTAPVAVATPPMPLPVLNIAPAFEPPAAPQAPPWEAQVVAVPARARKRRGWIVPAAIAAVGLIASGALGYFLYTTTVQRDAARHQLAASQATLKDTQAQLAARKATDAYLNLYVLSSGRVETDYQALFVCDSYSTCRSAAQDALTDMKAFQSARAAMSVPAAMASADSQLGDALSSAIAADQEVISAMDNDDRTKLDDGYKKFNEAMLSFAKAETALALTFS